MQIYTTMITGFISPILLIKKEPDQTKLSKPLRLSGLSVAWYAYFRKSVVIPLIFTYP